MESADAVVVGAGHNGLVCAAYLARAGLDVLVLERNPEAGGCLFATSSDAAPGHRFELGGLEHSAILGTGVIEELELARHGLEYVRRHVNGLHAFGDGTTVAIGATVAETAAEFARLDPADGDAYARIAPLASAVADTFTWLRDGPAPPFALLRRAARLTLGRRAEPLLDLASGSVAEVAERWFRSPHARAVAISRAAFSGIPPWEPGTAAVFALTPAGHGKETGRVQGGTPAFVRALLGALEAAGGRVRCGAGVNRLAPSPGGGWDAHLEDGEAVHARRAVVAAVPPRHTLLDLVDPEALPARVQARAARMRTILGNVGQATIGVAFDMLPELPWDVPAAYAGGLFHLAPRPDSVLAAYRAAALGQVPDDLLVVLSFVSVLDSSAAPPGRATAWFDVFTTNEFAGGRTWADAGAEMADRIWASAEAAWPGLRSRTIHEIMMTPPDLAARTGGDNSGSHIAPSLDQLLGARPAPGLARYRAGASGLYLSGCGTHPGPGINGASGRNAARAVLADLGLGAPLRERLARLGRLAGRGVGLLRTARRAVRVP